jgi:hypothetical protein
MSNIPEITRCTQCGKKFTPVRRPATTWNRNIFGDIDVLCKQCVDSNERASSAAIDEVLRGRKAREDKSNNKH